MSQRVTTLPPLLDDRNVTQSMEDDFNEAPMTQNGKQTKYF